MTFNGYGIYRILHGHVAVRVALAEGSSDDGSPVVGWNVKYDYLNHMWVVTPVPGEADTYHIQNLVAGTYMDLTGGSATNGTLVIGSHKTDEPNQKWIIKKETSGTGFWKIQNKATNTFVDLLNGSGKDGASIVGWQGSWDDGASLGHQHWTFDPQSLSSDEVHANLRANPHVGQDFTNYMTDGVYLILSRDHYQEIWRDSGLQNRKFRRKVFDAEDFSFVYKAEVSKWCDDHFKADGFNLLCGIMFGRDPKGFGHAYNWMVDASDHLKIIFFEPQNSQFLEDWGYTAYFGVF